MLLRNALKDAGMPPTFLKRLHQGPLVCDGAIGTELYARGRAAFDRGFDELNFTQPELVKSVHLDYIQAGAELIETNTFSANRVRLAAHGLQDRVEDLNRAAVEIAQEARRLTGQHVYIAGSIGPLGR